MKFGVPSLGGFSAALRWRLPPKGGTPNFYPSIFNLILSICLLRFSFYRLLFIKLNEFFCNIKHCSQNNSGRIDF